MKNTRAFTLVELIVVITILAILGTIGFISLQGYSVNARDSVKISNLKTIESGLIFTHTKTGEFPSPDDSIDISASGSLIRTQGYVGNGVLITTKVSEGGNIDPITGQYYDYSLSANKQDYQLGTYFEKNQSSLQSMQNVNAEDLFYKSQGESLGMVFDTSSKPAHWNTGALAIDIRNPGAELTIRFPNGDQVVSASGSELFSAVYNRGKDLLDNKDLARLDDSLIVYIDTDTMTDDGTKFKDLSPYGHDFECKDGNYSIFSCLSQNTETGWRGSKAFKVTNGVHLESLGTTVNTLSKEDSFTYFATIRLFNENYSPLLPMNSEENCVTFTNTSGIGATMRRNTIVNKTHSFNLHFPCEPNWYDGDIYMRVADTQGHGDDFFYEFSEGWYNVVSTYSADTNKIKMFINGRPVPGLYESEWTSNGVLSEPLRIGLGYQYNPEAGLSFSQSEFILDDFRMYKRALSEAEILKMYELFVDKN